MLIESTKTIAALRTVLNEILNGAAPQAAWILNPGDPGLLKSLDGLSARDASASPENGAAPICAHVDHLRYGLNLLNRWSNGDNAFAHADYTQSWRRTEVSEAEWAQLRQDLAREAEDWRAALERSRDLTPFESNAVIASVAHLANHLGAMRQINRALRGPSA
jgi:hypothetical protein